jgi:phenylpropionate dioxygenase-like ring-hydroxylating dioxygenase large terminal subunit
MRWTGNYPSNCWYVVATSADVGRELLATRALGTPVVLYRTLAGAAVALEDRDAHRPYPLSLGRLDGDNIVSGYTGFVYDPSGRCVHVPTQDAVPFGAAVRAFPIHEDGSFVWAWFGEPLLAALRPPPQTPWLQDPGWATLGGDWETAANFQLLHENFADITHVAVVHPAIAPPVLRGTPPPLEVEVSESTVSFSRTYPASPLADWHARLLGRPAQTPFVQQERGVFVSPGLWVDHWDVRLDGGPDDVATFRFTHAVTPIGPNRTRHHWRVSRNFSLAAASDDLLRPMFTEYYRRVQAILQTMQSVLDVDGARDEVNVSADAAALQVRRILNTMTDKPPSPHP